MPRKASIKKKKANQKSASKGSAFDQALKHGDNEVPGIG